MVGAPTRCGQASGEGDACRLRLQIEQPILQSYCELTRANPGPRPDSDRSSQIGAYVTTLLSSCSTSVRRPSTKVTIAPVL